MYTQKNSQNVDTWVEVKTSFWSEAGVKQRHFSFLAAISAADRVHYRLSSIQPPVHMYKNS